MEIDLYFQFTQSCKITQEYLTSFFYLVTKQTQSQSRHKHGEGPGEYKILGEW